MNRLDKTLLFVVPLSILIFVYLEDHRGYTDELTDFASNEAWYGQFQSELTPPENCRPADQTFLTFLEWFVVYSSKEQAEYFVNATSTSFPYRQHVKKYWEAVDFIRRKTTDKYPFNKDYWLMIDFIGYSTSLEYLAKAFYENIFGRVSIYLKGKKTSWDDHFYQQYTEAYVDFIFSKPWYEFSYGRTLYQYWATTKFDSSGIIRNIERKIFITSELFLKWIYASVIRLSTETLYGEAGDFTYVILDNIYAEISQSADIINVKSLANNQTLVKLPRYKAFTDCARELSQHNVNFVEIAGNSNAILITVDFNKNKYKDLSMCEMLFKEHISTQNEIIRVTYVTLVVELGRFIQSCEANGGLIVHIYDY